MPSRPAVAAPVNSVATVVDAAISELERRRDQIDETIAALRRLGEPQRASTPASAIDKPPKNGKPAVSPHGGRKVDAAQAARVRELYEKGLSGPDIEHQTGVKAATVYYRAKVGKWKRPKATAAAAGEQLPGKVRCPSCELWTERDPCTNCGKKVRK